LFSSLSQLTVKNPGQFHRPILQHWIGKIFQASARHLVPKNNLFFNAPDIPEKTPQTPSRRFIKVPDNPKMIILEILFKSLKEKSKLCDPPLRQFVGVRGRTGPENRHFIFSEHHELRANVSDGLADVVDDNPSQLGAMFTPEFGARSLDDHLTGQLLKIFYLWKRFYSHSFLKQGATSIRFLYKETTITGRIFTLFLKQTSAECSRIFNPFSPDAF
jgi:hypothetical protein